MVRHHAPLEDYLAAKVRHDEADRIYNRAMRTFCKLEDRIGDEKRAFIVAGVELADEWMVAAYHAEREARRRLKQYVRGLDIVQKFMMTSAALCADHLPEPAND
jgi:hypothetical protein